MTPSTNAPLRAIVTDLDDTLLDTKGQLPDRNRAALERFRREVSNGPVVVATGRARFGRMAPGGKAPEPAATAGAMSIGEGVVTHVICEDGALVLERDPR